MEILVLKSFKFLRFSWGSGGQGRGGGLPEGRRMDQITENLLSAGLGTSLCWARAGRRRPDYLSSQELTVLRNRGLWCLPACPRPVRCDRTLSSVNTSGQRFRQSSVREWNLLTQITASPEGLFQAQLDPGD